MTHAHGVALDHLSAPGAPAAPLGCPHCEVALPGGWSSRRAGRCPTCGLHIAAQRAIALEVDRHAGRSAAGLIANRARRTGVAPVDPVVVVAGLLAIAQRTACGVARLRMIDYQRLSAVDPGIPSLDVVLATFSTWKLARTMAERRHADAVLEAPEFHAKRSAGDGRPVGAQSSSNASDWRYSRERGQLGTFARGAGGSM